MDIRELDISAQYLAGFFDGEGCIAFRVGRRVCVDGSKTARISAACSITHTHLPTLKAISNKWGGHIYVHKSKYYDMEKVRQGYMLHWQTQKSVVEVLLAIQPYVVTKKDQVDFFLAEYVPTMKDNIGRKYRLTKEQTAKRFEVREKLSAMKAVEFICSRGDENGDS